MKKVYREYSNGEITVEWRSELCNHSSVCINDLPAVFNVIRIPWINMKGASTKDIIQTVEDCPTGAIAWRYNNKSKSESSDVLGEAHLVLVPKGPIVFRGKLKIKHENGEIEERTGVASLCRCGLSKKMPFCDGAHFKGSEDRG